MKSRLPPSSWMAMDGSGDVSPMEDLFRRERDGILRMCRTLLGNEHDAEEAMQEAFARIASRLATLHGEPGAYLNVVARRVCWELRRTSDRIGPLDVATAADSDPEEATIRRVSMQRSWSRLSPTERRLIVGSFAGYTYDELAARVGLSAKSVSVGLHRARRRAREVAQELVLLVPGLRARLAARVRQPALAEGMASLSQLAALPATVGLLLGLALPPSTAPRPPIPPTVAAAPVPVLSRPLAVAPAVAERTGARQNAGAAPMSARFNSPTRPPLPQTQFGIMTSGSPDGASPDDTRTMVMTPAPQYASNHVIVATGSWAPCGCTPIMRSTDGGATWTASPVPARSGDVAVLPPDYPADPRIILVTNQLVYGQQPACVRPSFASTLCTPLPFDGPIAFDAMFDSGFPVIYGTITDVGVVAMNLDTLAMHVLLATPPFDAPTVAAPVAPVDTAVYIGDVRGMRLLACRRDFTCDTRALGEVLPHSLTLDPDDPTGNVLVTWNGRGYVISYDGGRTVRPLNGTPDPGVEDVRPTGVPGSGALWVETQHWDGHGSGPLVVWAQQAASTAWTALPLPSGLLRDRSRLQFLVLPGNRIVLVDYAGYWCTVDGGRSWGLRCPLA